MSLEAALAENTAALLANIEALKEIGLNQTRLLAAVPDAAPKTATRRKAKDDTPPAEPETGKVEEPAATESGADVAGNASDGPTLADFTELAKTNWLMKADTPEKKAPIGQFLVALQSHFGITKIFENLTDPEQIKQATFFVKRKQAGLDVDFGADYDFSGPIDQGGAVEDDFG